MASCTVYLKSRGRKIWPGLNHPKHMFRFLVYLKSRGRVLVVVGVRGGGLSSNIPGEELAWEGLAWYPKQSTIVSGQSIIVSGQSLIVSEQSIIVPEQSIIVLGQSSGQSVSFRTINHCLITIIRTIIHCIRTLNPIHYIWHTKNLIVA